MVLPPFDPPGYRLVAKDWLHLFSTHLIAGDVDALVTTFMPDGWLRDVLTFSWDTRSLEGPQNIANYLRGVLQKVQISKVKLDESPHLAPTSFTLTASVSGIELAFKFETTISRGRGLARLLFNEAGENIGQWKAISVSMMMDELKGYEESGPELGVYGGHTLSWSEVKAERQRRIENDPLVVIVGAGQTGLQIAARFKSLNIPTLVIERKARVGDTWRERYPTLSLHTPRMHSSLLYQPYPHNWPIFTPRDKLADWLEQYPVSQDLVVWTNTSIIPQPTYDSAKKKWNLGLNRNGTTVELHPTHIVLATGTLGAPLLPLDPDPKFRGEVLHAASYQGGHLYSGKRVVVVGAANTAADMCQDLCFRGAKSVTMIQRSSTCVVSGKNLAEGHASLWPEGVPVEVGDFKFASMPMGLYKKIGITRMSTEPDRDRDIHEMLESAGFKLNNGPDGAGRSLLVVERFAGHWVDVGCAELVASGKVKLKHGVEVKAFTEDTVVFSDGSSLKADVVIFATGYQSVREYTKELFGDSIISQTKEVWGLDHEGEINGSYRPTGHSGLWYAAGDFYHSRWGSKQLGLLIKAMELGLLPL
ncbi:hypothetical protein JAAARDRAFT_76447 [Jaapia argillacea MUCL 33604]|uniref:FAD/NAD(P)-binding domain-containing protein n=1 Tax=Jaapia argillacea MUCL 33604 TaxID=933084 RepID=A0A067Q998_9AGAM|nr:hypothetical protein JAAARDRAFT_76447 [Jaapia argillacea MUCL 33604]